MTEVWYVQGEYPPDMRRWPTLFDTKLAAEKYARQLFPDEDPDKRYARIYCIEVNEES